MAQHRSTATCKSNTKHSSRSRQGKELSQMLGEWLDEYDKHNDGFINRKRASEYRIIRKILNDNFMNVSEDLSECINDLPNIWMFQIPKFEILLCTLFAIILPICNGLFFKIEIGIDVLSSFGRGIDLIYPIMALLGSVIIILSAKYLGGRADSMRRNLLTIKYLLRK